MVSKNHYFLNLSPSPWPLMNTLSVMNLALSVIMFLKYSKTSMFFMSLIMVIFITFNWWMSMKSELNKKGMNTEKMETSFKNSMMLFISSEVLFFFSMFWAYQHFNLVPEMDLSASWPPIMVKMFDATSIPILNTMILLSSGVTITLAHKLMVMKKKNKFIIMKIVTLTLGLMFSALQYEEYKNSFFCMSDGTFGSSFFLLTGFHGIHVIIGASFILINTLNKYFANTTKSNLSFEMAAWYWHFVDVVWMFVFYMLYYMNN